MLIAIDGPAVSGKGRIGRALAANLALPHLDPGRLFRVLRYTFSCGGLNTASHERTMSACHFDAAVPETPAAKRSDGWRWWWCRTRTCGPSCSIKSVISQPHRAAQ